MNNNVTTRGTGRRVALLAASDKQGLVEFATGLAGMGWGLIATSGSTAILRDAGLNVMPVDDLCGMPAMFGGRLKTLHSMIFGGLLYRRGNAVDEADATRWSIPRIDLFAGNFYPLATTCSESFHSGDTLVDCIDIGGPAMLRAAAKNYAHVIPVIAPTGYQVVLDALREAHGMPEKIALRLRRRLAVEAFSLVSQYDAAVTEMLADTANDTELFSETDLQPAKNLED